jgi:thiol-disulfide isomerase/thioredoxin
MSVSRGSARLAPLALAALLAACGGGTQQGAGTASRGGDAGPDRTVRATRIARPPTYETTRSAGTVPTRAPSLTAERAFPRPTRTAVRLATKTPVPTVETSRTGTPETAVAGDFEIVAYGGARRLGGREVNFRSLFAEGKPVVLNLWAGRCPPCRLEMPGFQAVWEEHRRDVLFVGVDVGAFTGLGSRADARALMDELGVTYPSGYAVDPSPLTAYRVRTMPTTLFFTGEGALVHRRDGYLSEDDLRGIVRQLAASS